MKRCETCGEVLQDFEIRCTRCSVNTVMPESYYILITGPTLSYRIVNGIKKAIVSALIGLLIIAGIIVLKDELLPRIISGNFLLIIRIVIGIAGIVSGIICFSIVYLALSEIKSNATYAFTKTKMKFSDVIEHYDSIEDEVPKETKFTDKEFSLADFSKIRVVQGWLGRHFGYGNIEIYTDQDNKPKWIIPGVAKPDNFKKKLDLILLYRNVPASDYKLIPNSASPKDENRGKTIDKSAAKRNKIFTLKISIACILILAILIGIGKWYRTTIPVWDECIRNNLCFVCHQHVDTVAEGAEDFGKNIRLCTKHSTGWQAWHWLYIVPASIFIYEDAPIKTGGFFKTIIRWALIILWAVGILVSSIIVVWGFIKILRHDKLKLDTDGLQ